MNDISRMHEEKSSQNLIDKVLNVVVTQFLARIDDSMEVRLHQISDDVYVGVACSRFWLENVEEPNDIIVLEKLYFSS